MSLAAHLALLLAGLALSVHEISAEQTVTKIGNESYVTCRGRVGRDCTGERGGLNEATRCISLEIKTDSDLMVKEDVCVCYYPYGQQQPESVSSDPMCFTAECMNHADACSGWSGTSILYFAILVILTIIGVLAVARTFFVTVKFKKMKGNVLGNAAGTTVAFSVFCSVFPIIWTIAYYPAMASRQLWLTNILYVVGISGSAIFGVASALNMSLMWLQVAQSAKTLKKGSTNLGRGPIAFVATFATLFAIIVILLFGIIQNNVVGGGVAWAAIVGVLVTFQVGVRSIVKATSKPGQPPSAGLQRIINVNRRFFLLMALWTVGCLGYAAVLTLLRSRRSHTLGALMAVFIFFIISQVFFLAVVIAQYVYDSSLKKKKKKTQPSSGTAVSTRKASTTSATMAKTEGTNTTTAVTVGNTVTDTDSAV